MQIPTIAEASNLIHKRKLSPVELIDACLTRIESVDASLNAFITVTVDRARQEAIEAEHRMMKGELRGRLDGIPIGHKDILFTKGVQTSAHSKHLKGWVPEGDAHVVRSLADAGAISLGKLAMHEFALGGPSFDLPWPPARNPWDTRRFTSGSSSGTAAAVAAGLILGGTGTDTAGSIAAPAALCGVVGLKPTYGLCSKRGILPLAPSLDHVGPLCWTAEDCALLLEEMAGYDREDPASAKRAPADLAVRAEDNVRGIRIGIASDWHETEHPVTPAVKEGLDRAISVWTEQGAHVDQVTMPRLEEYRATCFVILTAEAYSVHEKALRSNPSDFGEQLRLRLLLGATLSAADYVNAVRQRRRLCMATAAATADVDVIVTAGAANGAPFMTDVPRWGDLEKPGFYEPFNITGWPSIVFCSGFGIDHMPVSVQIAAKPFMEHKLIQLAAAFEKATNFRNIRPRITNGQARAFC
ncbi:aspartyl-tRNA(Asn)/glutamyl-tRNA(Gln) amidotransferase subunit A [Paraburkholderia sp. BL23I1N1]|uniref:amidase n=1 Tax=unclassified Paraburkholderia TaxID=2615204 RepID=UPI000E271334|nr:MULTISPECIES: amidase [unclassified Paraburkholderia]REE18563.1 aspartyl-tRNA(Asn)/glutamyl-tRNA(Gln) amidotransferase subunit A [Paraburkholderia sp. BL27I4N3]RKE35577.1 aspartyl-tRNA(Asn)/glutamyl-tRNA(Gln) amidotransferase subunit A [Paraburkholderia sp. BL23I1N1]